MVQDRGIRGAKTPERRRDDMKIGEVAKETGLSVSNIRFYERKELLCPRRDQESRYRDYEEEDIRRLKEIRLLRKLGLSLESIYLMYQGQAEYEGLLRRQEEELAEQIGILQGSLELCRRLETEGALSALDVDGWLVWVRQEETKGKRFAAAEEWMEDLAEFSGIASFRGDPYVGKFFFQRNSARILAALLLLSLVLTAVSSVRSGGGVLGKAVIGFWLLYFLGFGLDFLRFHRRRRREEKEGIK